jgi:hypothetical protein
MYPNPTPRRDSNRLAFVLDSDAIFVQSLKYDDNLLCFFYRTLRKNMKQGQYTWRGAHTSL